MLLLCCCYRQELPIGMIICDWCITGLSRAMSLKDHLFFALTDREPLAVPVHGHCSPLRWPSVPLFPKLRYPCISRSCQAPHDCSCKASKWVRFSWQDAWKFELSSCCTRGSLSLQSSVSLFTVHLNFRSDMKDFKDFEILIMCCACQNRGKLQKIQWI